MKAWVQCVCALVLFVPEAAGQESDLDRRVQNLLREELDLLRAEMRLTVSGAVDGARKRSEAQRIERALELISPEFLEAQLRFLSSDGLNGRNAGSPSERRANDFIARHFAAAGLKPVGDKETYFQAFTFSNDRRSRNCVALLEGSDPDLKDQIVVIGAHHDHVGTAVEGHRAQMGGATQEDRIWNGADDNGSGTTAVLAVARAFAAAGLRPRRSILFMTFGAEEWGLLGSRHYTRNPLFPIERHVAMINLDMVGRNPEDPVGLYGVGTAEIYPELARRTAERTGLKIEPIDGVRIRGGGNSDHASFHRAKVPTLFFFTGFHANYHRVSDSFEKIDYPHHAKVARTAALLLWELANRDGTPEFRQPPRRERRRRDGGRDDPDKQEER